MKAKPSIIGAAIAMLSSKAAMADCGPGQIANAAGQCVPISSVTVIVDPTWLVAAAILLITLAGTILYLAVQVGRLCNRLENVERGR